MTIDFCVPFWGDPADLRATVDSVLAQTEGDWRLTVIDDCYPDESVPAYFAALDEPRVHYRRNERNVGIVENFRRAVAAARGPYVVVLGSDDLLHPEYVRTMLRSADAHPDADIFQPGVRVIDASGHKTATLVDTVKLRMLTPRRERDLRAESMASSLLIGDWLYWPSLMFRTETIRRFDFRDDLPIILDLAILLDIAFENGSLHYLPDVIFSYRRHAESASQKTLLDGTRFEDERDFYREITERARGRGWKRAKRAAQWRVLSRLHGLAVLPTVLRRGTPRARRAALSLAFAA